MAPWWNKPNVRRMCLKDVRKPDHLNPTHQYIPVFNDGDYAFQSNSHFGEDEDRFDQNTSGSSNLFGGNPSSSGFNLPNPSFAQPNTPAGPNTQFQPNQTSTPNRPSSSSRPTPMDTSGSSGE